MKLLLKKVRLIEPGKSHSGQVVDILVKDDIIEQIGPDISADDAQIIDSKGACVSPGWFDLRANFRDPGDEHKESIASGLSAAAGGGFTHVLVMPSTNPPIQTKADIEYIKARNANHPVTLHPAGVLSVGREGKDISEMFDMKAAEIGRAHV